MDVRLFCSDLDGTLLGAAESVRRFRAVWNGLPAERRPTLCYNTGRLVNDALKVVRSSGLPVPDFVLGGVGTQAYDVTRATPLPAFQERFAKGWNLELVERTIEHHLPAAQRQPPEFLHRYKSSWFLQAAPTETVTDIEARLLSVGVEAVVVYSSQRDLDVLPRQADKGKSLVWLAQHLGISARTILVAGDSGNDSSMFKIPGVRGILVENARPELLKAAVGCDTYTATGILAEGVMDGLRNWGVIDPRPGRPRSAAAAGIAPGPCFPDGATEP